MSRAKTIVTPSARDLTYERCFSNMTRSSSNRKPTIALSLLAYRAASSLLGPVARHVLKKRMVAGKEDGVRIRERYGIAETPRPEGDLIWLHSASVGEALSTLPLIEELLAQDGNRHFLVTTGTVTSAALMVDRLPSQAIHQFVPLDHPAYVARFLDHWQPDCCILVESELWPNLIQETARRKIPIALVNGRISPKSYRNWRYRRGALHTLFACFDTVLAQDQESVLRFAKLGIQGMRCVGNLKMAALPLPVDVQDLQDMRDAVGNRPAWLAASTHQGEEEQIIAAAQMLLPRYPDLLTIIVPRHPARGTEIMALAAPTFKKAQRTSTRLPDSSVNLYIADTMGELGLFYRLTDITFVGGSLSAIGGHNPMEPARLRNAILYGPQVFNFTETYKAMRQSGGTALVRNERDLAAALTRLLDDTTTRRSMAHKAAAWSQHNAENVLSTTVEALTPILPDTQATCSEGVPKDTFCR